MIKVKWRDFYGDSPTKPLLIEKFFLDDGKSLETRQMTYELSADGTGMYPTFEVDDVVIDRYGKGETYHIYRYERGFQELHVELLSKEMKLTGKKTYLDVNEVFHQVKDVEWI